MNAPKTFADGRVVLHAGDCLGVLDSMAENSVDAVVTDPPYHLTSIIKRFGADGAAPVKPGKTGVYARGSKGFMGQQWDGGDIAFTPALWAKVLRVLKPGGHLVAFAGTKGSHRMVCAIEDAGFEVRDSLAWLYGTGFPKSHNVAKSAGAEWQGWGTALKPAHEPICLARKPLSEATIAANVLRWGTGALNIDACRIETSESTLRPDGNAKFSGGREGTVALGGAWNGNGFSGGHVMGRWPANVCHDGSDEVVASFPYICAASGAPRNNSARGRSVAKGEEAAHVTRGHADDGGSAARFFYSAKANADDRMGSRHPTVKPLGLMRWLVRLVTPPGGTVLDPFAGTGPTGAACWHEGFNAVLIEREAAYQADISLRMSMLGESPAMRKAVAAGNRDAILDAIMGGA